MSLKKVLREHAKKLTRYMNSVGGLYPGASNLGIDLNQAANHIEDLERLERLLFHGSRCYWVDAAGVLFAHENACESCRWAITLFNHPSNQNRLQREET